MQSKLKIIAQVFARKVADDLPNYVFVFPNHRAGLFFRKYLAENIQRAMFAPRVLSINECFSELSDLQVADQLTLLLRLYSEYKDLQPDVEGLDRFLYWGKMMLADFSEIDNHLVPHVEALFASVRDLQAINEKFDYLTENQRKALARFWLEFQESDTRHPDAELHAKFLHTWDLLYPLYKNLRENLLREGLAYEGLLHREVIDNWDKIPQNRFAKNYVFLGFNALTTSERELMLRLQDMGKADFYFDYDSPYLRDVENRASLFMEDNLRLFKSRYEIPLSEDICEAEISLVSVPSTIGEVHEVHRILSEIIPDDCQDFTRTAVVLPDEQLLIPLLNAFPATVGKLNVTMGYPLRATSLYMPVAYPEQFLKPMPEQALAFIHEIREYLLSLNGSANAEAIYQLTKVLDRLENAVLIYPQIAFSVTDIQQLLKMLTLEATIPYAGEPLDGLQVMGVLETRALDFDNVIITDFNDELYPGRSRSNSFIPYVLRIGFDLPTPERQNAIFAYNFYRMLSYAKKVWLITNSASDDQHSGEVSRYFYQLQWQYNKPIKHTVVNYSLDSKSTISCEPILKDERTGQLNRISASALGAYLRCPKLFYYKYIARIKEPDKDESISVSEATLGNVLHAIMQNLYTPYVGKNVTESTIQTLLANVNDDAYWSSLEDLKKLKGDVLAELVVRSYVNNILNYDYAQTPFQYLHAEVPIEAQLPNGITIIGTVDRVDSKAGMVRVIDYKTGSVDLAYKSMADVFGVVPESENGEYVMRKTGNEKILQTLLYCWVLSKDYPTLAPYIYSARRVADVSTITGVYHAKTEEMVVVEDTLKQEFITECTRLIDEIRNMEIPFYPAENDHACSYCSFVELCGRQAKKR